MQTHCIECKHMLDNEDFCYHNKYCNNHPNSIIELSYKYDCYNCYYTPYHWITAMSKCKECDNR
jgi:hypothetical protein